MAAALDPHAGFHGSERSPTPVSEYSRTILGREAELNCRYTFGKNVLSQTIVAGYALNGFRCSYGSAIRTARSRNRAP